MHKDRVRHILLIAKPSTITIQAELKHGNWNCWFSASAKVNSVRTTHPVLPDTPGDLTSLWKYFQTLPDPPGAKQSALRLCKSVLRGCWKHLQLWRCIQDAPSRIVKFWSAWSRYTDQWEASREGETAARFGEIHRERPRPLSISAGDLMLYSWSSGSFIITTYFVFLYSSLLQSQDLLHHNIVCIISVTLYIYIQSIWL